MARKTKQVEIDGLKYKIRQVGGMDGIRVKAQAMSVLGGPLASIISRGISPTDLMNVDVETDEERTGLEKMIKQASSSINPDGMVRLMEMMVYGCVQWYDGDGTWIDIDDEATYAHAIEHADNPLHDISLLTQCLMTNLLPTSAATSTSLREPSPAATDQ